MWLTHLDVGFIKRFCDASVDGIISLIDFDHFIHRLAIDFGKKV